MKNSLEPQTLNHKNIINDLKRRQEKQKSYYDWGTVNKKPIGEGKDVYIKINKQNIVKEKLKGKELGRRYKVETNNNKLIRNRMLLLILPNSDEQTTFRMDKSQTSNDREFTLCDTFMANIDSDNTDQYITKYGRVVKKQSFYQS